MRPRKVEEDAQKSSYGTSHLVVDFKKFVAIENSVLGVPLSGTQVMHAIRRVSKNLLSFSSG